MGASSYSGIVILRQENSDKVHAKTHFNDVLIHLDQLCQEDPSVIGHNVPAQLVCNMSFTDTPTPGLELISEQSGLRSGLSNFFTKLAKLKPASETSLTGDVLHVVRTSQSANEGGSKSKKSKTSKSNPTDDRKASDPKTADSKTGD
ncbi:hypothetical protein BH10CYA1_BH10CYA1_52590 [soil metagenome]